MCLSFDIKNISERSLWSINIQCDEKGYFYYLLMSKITDSQVLIALWIIANVQSQLKTRCTLFPVNPLYETQYLQIECYLSDIALD